MTHNNHALKKVSHLTNDFSAVFKVKIWTYLYFEIVCSEQPLDLTSIFYKDENLLVKREDELQWAKYKVKYSFEKPGEYVLKCYKRGDRYCELLSEYKLVYNPE